MDNSAFALNSQGIGSAASPRQMYSFFILGLCRDFYGALGNENTDTLDKRAAGIIGFIPDEKLRMKLWSEYTELRKGTNETTAAVVVIGRCIDTLAEPLEWVATAEGSYL